MKERGTLQMDAVITQIALGGDGKPWVSVALPVKPEDGSMIGYANSPSAQQAVNAWINFPNSDIPLNLHVGGKVVITLSFE